MPTFATPQPVTVSIDLVIGDTRVTASERNDTVVEVRPREASNELDVKAASQTRVEYNDGKLTIKAPKPLQSFFTSKTGTVDVTIELPSGSHLRGRTAHGDFHGEGRLGECSFKTSFGDISLDQAAAVHLSTMHGEIIVDRATGDSNVTGSGELRVGAIFGKASIKNLNGDSWIGEVTGDISLNSAHGNITVERAAAGVVARTAFGNVRIGDIARGTVVLHTAFGELELGIRKGTAAWLDVKSSLGRVRNSLESTYGPDETTETVQIRARTHGGDIVIRRATPLT